MQIKKQKIADKQQKERIAPQVTANNTLRMGYTRIEHLAGGAASVAALCNKTPI